MYAQGEEKRKLPERGEIIWENDLFCPWCKQKGIFWGRELEYGAFYECAEAKCCPACGEIFEERRGINFAPYEQKRFLPLMKKKLLNARHTFCQAYLAVGDDFRPGCTFLEKGSNSCPCCGGETYIFHKDLGAVDYYDNFWTVCVSSACDWPGEHYENYSPAPA
jgi:hypothetical protein